MAKFTQSIREIIFDNAGQYDPSTIEGMTNIAKAVIFGDELNVISSEYRDRFVASFCLQFFNREIGQETLPLWRYDLKSKVYDNAELINGTFDYLDKQIFADYRVKKLNKAGTKSDKVNVVVDGSVKSQDTLAATKANGGSSETAHTGSQVESATGSDTDKHTGTVDRVRTSDGITERGGSDVKVSDINENRSASGSDVASHTGSSETSRAGVDNTKNTGSDESTSIGSDVATKNGTVRNERDYSSNASNVSSSATDGGDHIVESNQNQRTESGKYADTQSGKQTNTNKDNGIVIDFDTPMGSLENMRSPNSSMEGQGVEAVAGGAGMPNREYNYMSAARENDRTVVDETEFSNFKTERTFDNYVVGDSGSRTVDGSLSHVQTSSNTLNGNTGEDDTVTTYDTQDGMSRSNKNTTVHDTSADRVYSGSDKRTDDLRDQRDTQSAQNTVANNTDTTEYGSNESRKNNESGADIFDDTHESSRQGSNATEYDDKLTRVDDLKENRSESKVGDVKTDTATATDGQHASVEDVEQIDSTFNYELFMKAAPMMNKIWDEFDDIFFMIIDVFE